MYETIMRNPWRFALLVAILAVAVLTALSAAPLLPYIGWWFWQLAIVYGICMLAGGWALGNIITLLRYSR